MNLLKEINIKRDTLFLKMCLIAFCLIYSFSFTSFVCGVEELKTDVVRLHILANSDSEADQAVKLQVRDALLKENTRLLKSGVNKKNARAYFDESKERLTYIAEKTLRENGFGYDVKITLNKEFFETRKYSTQVFPAGEYLSLKVILGKGEGHNWWCVMFPPMCVPSASEISVSENEASAYLSENSNRIINGGDKYIIKLKIVEIYEELKEFFK